MELEILERLATTSATNDNQFILEACSCKLGVLNYNSLTKEFQFAGKCKKNLVCAVLMMDKFLTKISCEYAEKRKKILKRNRRMIEKTHKSKKQRKLTEFFFT